METASKLSGLQNPATPEDEDLTEARGEVLRGIMDGLYIGSPEFLRLRALALRNNITVDCEIARYDWGSGDVVITRRKAQFP